MRKPWTVAANDEVLAECLPRLCQGHQKHARVAGAITAGSASYPERMAQAIHDAWRESVNRRTAAGGKDERRRGVASRPPPKAVNECTALTAAG